MAETTALVAAALVDGNPAQRREAFEARGRGFLVSSYEQLIRDLDLVHAWGPDLVVLDEAQRIKNWATKTALTVKQLGVPLDSAIQPRLRSARMLSLAVCLCGA
jgi:hypothetical protein